MKRFIRAAAILISATLVATVQAKDAPKPVPPAPGPEVLEGCKKLDLDPPAYMTEHFIVQAPPERINKAVGWVKHVEKTVYPTMVDILGYKPNLELYAVMFQDDYPKHPAVYSGIGRFDNTDFQTHRIHVRCGKLDAMPPYQTGGGVTWETIHAFLNDAKKQADWKPIWETELLDLIFEMELYKRLDMEADLDNLWHSKLLKDEGSRKAVLAAFWKEYGWQPFQKLIVKLHENPDFKPMLDEGTFVYEMSIGAGRDVSAFFETRRWKVPPETKLLIKRQLSRQ